jgi:protein-S-isoprenylcysteine O-methyltransferase Ste14
VRPLVYNDGVAAAAFFGTFTAWSISEIVLQARTRGDEARDPSYRWMLIGSGAGIILAFLASPLGLRLPGPDALPPVLGIVVIVLGAALRWWSVATLGRFFTVTVGVAEDQRVIDTGPYARVRHPSYTGILVIYLGLGIGLDSWLSIAAAVVVPGLACAYRIGHEERELRAGLGESYDAYSRRTHRLVPGLW